MWLKSVKQVIRSIRGSKLFTLINILGLTLGMFSTF